MTAMTTTFVRPNNGLPLTFLIVGDGKSIGGEDIWLVKEYGFSKTFGVLKMHVHPITPSPLMMEQLNGWLHMINYQPEPL